jgi:hypothetical protein
MYVLPKADFMVADTYSGNRTATCASLSLLAKLLHEAVAQG